MKLKTSLALNEFSKYFLRESFGISDSKVKEHHFNWPFEKANGRPYLIRSSDMTLRSQVLHPLSRY